ncbi:nuclear transport factor 2 family protein [Aliiroseovarius lamellibrachiae]|uniref:nuclear transport factor 2 family protein n=1 Tax=Aliiroseovarius lamellibrachiae TaxID=1924933 RepID=UPI001BE12917|nr:nuclear transport factor 2 family protein [Aliiroseovarius lamellibrachiae]MBT2131564.1 nuclear transport factor 2 family protein [Aliiroseovarius lamellibrachiae]
MTPTETVLAAVTALFVDFDPEAGRKLLNEDYIQHNPAVPTGAEPILGFLPTLKESGLSAEPHRVIAEGDLVVLHSTLHNAQAFGGETLVAFDVFRIEDGKVAEHWDNLQVAVSADQTASGNTMTDGVTEITDHAKTAENKALVKGFVADVLHGAAPEKITDYISTETYIQHNPMVGNGLEGLGTALTAMAEAGQAMAYTDTHMVVADGNFVFTASEGTLGDQHTAFFDLFRVEGGKIVEHWDTISAIPDEMAHDNGKF